MNRCQLQYLHPQRLEWVDCAQEVTAGTSLAPLCPFEAALHHTMRAYELPTRR